MKLVLKTQDAPAMTGGKAFFLCDENGNKLPGQYAVSVEQQVNTLTRVTVTFNVDGEEISIDR